MPARLILAQNPKLKWPSCHHFKFEEGVDRIRKKFAPRSAEGSQPILAGSFSALSASLRENLRVRRMGMRVIPLLRDHFSVRTESDADFGTDIHLHRQAQAAQT